MTGLSLRWLGVPLTLALGCAPGGVERIDHLDASGQLLRVSLPAGATQAQTVAQLGRPNAIRRGPGATVYWLYTYEHLRYNYVLTFRGERLAHVRYMPRPGAEP